MFDKFVPIWDDFSQQRDVFCFGYPCVEVKLISSATLLLQKRGMWPNLKVSCRFVQGSAIVSHAKRCAPRQPLHSIGPSLKLISVDGRVQIRASLTPPPSSSIMQAFNTKTNQYFKPSPSSDQFPCHTGVSPGHQMHLHPRLVPLAAAESA